MLKRLLTRIQESFSAKIIALVVASVLMTSFVVGLATTRTTSRFLSTRTSEKFPSTLTATKSRVRLWYEKQFGALRELGQAPVFGVDLAVAANLKDNGTRAVNARHKISRYYSLVQQRFPVFQGLACVSGEGAVIASSGEMETFPSERIAELLIVSGGEPVVAAPADLRGERQVQWLAVPLPAEGQKPLWTVARVELSEIASILRDVRLGRGGDLYILDSQGRFVTRPNRAGEVVSANAGIQVPTRQTGQPTVEKRNSYDGRQVFMSMMFIDERNWWLVYEEDYTLAMQPVISAQRRVWVAVLIIGAIAILAALRIAQSILSPIHHLSVGASRINEGLVGVKIPKGPNDEIGMLISTFNQMAERITLSAAELQYKNKMLNAKNDQLEDMNVKLEQLSVTDGLTGLFNHRHFWNLLNTELTRVDLYQGDLALVLVDLDDFKQVNDQFGHAVGDLLLQSVAVILRDAVRDTDIVARYGGEEFAILLPDTNRQGVENVAQKLLDNVESMRFTVPETDIALKVTVSVGVSVFHGNRREFFNHADQALYKSKADGKNRVNYQM